MLIGATAAVVFCYFNPPNEVVVVEGTMSTTTRNYDAIQLVALSLLVGSAGSSILSAAQKKALAAVNATQIRLLTAGIDQTQTTAETPVAPDPPAQVGEVRAQLDVLKAMTTEATPTG